jgi:NADH-quinone oxidoreductase subunit M
VSLSLFKKTMLRSFNLINKSSFINISGSGCHFSKFTKSDNFVSFGDKCGARMAERFNTTMRDQRSSFSQSVYKIFYDIKNRVFFVDPSFTAYFYCDNPSFFNRILYTVFFIKKILFVAPYIFDYTFGFIVFFIISFSFKTYSVYPVSFLSILFILSSFLFFLFSILHIKDEHLIKIYAFWCSFLVFFCSCIMYFKIPTQGLFISDARIYYNEVRLYPWQWLFSSHSCVDGTSVYFFLLTTFAMFICVLASYSMDFKNRCAEYFALFFLMGFFLLNVFTQQNLFFFFIFFEGVLIPMFLLIGIWGPRKIQRVDAAYRFFMYTFLGSVPMLLAIFYIYSRVGSVNWFFFSYYSFFHEDPYEFTLHIARYWHSQLWTYSWAVTWDYVSGELLWINHPYRNHMCAFSSHHKGRVSPQLFTFYEEVFLWLAFFISFAVKMPLVPFHTWLPEAHVEAPTPVSMFLASVLLKMGSYGYLHFSLILFPNACDFFCMFYLSCCLLSIVYGSVCAITHIDFKKIVAYSSIAHMGYSMAALSGMPSASAMDGAVITMISHGFVSLAMFFSIGFLYERYGTRAIPYYTNISVIHPVFSFFFLFFCLSNMGFPGTSGFVGELIILINLLKTNLYGAIIASFTIIFSAVYNLWMFNRICWGSQNLNLSENKLLTVAISRNVTRTLLYHFNLERIRRTASQSRIFFYNFFIWLRYTVYEKFFFDCTFRESLIFVSLIFIILFIGLFPTCVFDNLSFSRLYNNSIMFIHSEYGSRWLEDWNKSPTNAWLGYIPHWPYRIPEVPSYTFQIGNHPPEPDYNPYFPGALSQHWKLQNVIIRYRTK